MTKLRAHVRDLYEAASLISAFHKSAKAWDWVRLTYREDKNALIWLAGNESLGLVVWLDPVSVESAADLWVSLPELSRSVKFLRKESRKSVVDLSFSPLEGRLTLQCGPSIIRLEAVQPRPQEDNAHAEHHKRFEALMKILEPATGSPTMRIPAEAFLDALERVRFALPKKGSGWENSSIDAVYFYPGYREFTVMAADGYRLASCNYYATITCTDCEQFPDKIVIPRMAVPIVMEIAKREAAQGDGELWLSRSNGSFVLLGYGARIVFKPVETKTDLFEVRQLATQDRCCFVDVDVNANEFCDRFKQLIEFLRRGGALRNKRSLSTFYLSVDAIDEKSGTLSLGTNQAVFSIHARIVAASAKNARLQLNTKLFLELPQNIWPKRQDEVVRLRIPTAPPDRQKRCALVIEDSSGFQFLAMPMIG